MARPPSEHNRGVHSLTFTSGAVALLPRQSKLSLADICRALATVSGARGADDVNLSGAPGRPRRGGR